MTYNVGIYIFDEVEVLDFAGPFEVFAVAARVQRQFQPGAAKPFEVFTVAQALRPVLARGGLIVQPNFDLRTHPPIDVLIVPGGVVTAESERPEITDWIARTGGASTITASVCTGATLLAKAGLLRGTAATTHWADIDDLRAAFPETTVHENKRWVDTGSIVTSGGISAGIDMSLYLVSRLETAELAANTARQMEFHSTSQNPSVAEVIVQRQLDAYNAHDLDALVATYAPDAQLFEHPATLLASGSAQIRERFALRLQEPDLHARLLRRTVMGSFVVDRELVTRNFPEGRGMVELIVTYEVHDQAIVNAWFKTGPKTLLPSAQ